MTNIVFRNENTAGHVGADLNYDKTSQRNAQTPITPTAPPKVRDDGMRVRLTPIDGITQDPVRTRIAKGYYFQCPPLESVQHKHGANHPTYTTASGEDFSQLGRRKLETFTLNTLVVEFGRFALYWEWDVEKLVDDLQFIADNAWPVELLATSAYDKRPEIHMPVTIISNTVTLKMGEDDARYVDLDFQEWRDPRSHLRSSKGPFPFTIQLNKDGTYSWPGGVPRPPRGHPLTFSAIAQYAYGKPSLASNVAKAQKPSMSKFGLHTNLIKAPRYKKRGGKVIVPAPPN